MKRAMLAIISTAAALVLLLSFKVHSQSASATPPAAVSGTNTGSSGSSASAGSTTSSGGGSSPSKKTTSATKTYTGEAADTRYGPVQVEITVHDGKVTKAEATEYPENQPRDEQINSYAIPQLNQEAVSVGNANIDMVSGATFTSQGYISSLQSALDKAGL